MDKDRINHRLEIVEAVLLSLAVLGTAWCAYEGTRWGGIQTFRMADANAKAREAAAKQVLAEQQRMLDGIVIMNLVQAVVEKKEKVVEFYVTRLRPEMRAAFTTWLAAKPLENADAPAHPLVMTEYANKVPVKFEEENRSLRAEGDQKMKEAMEANQIADNYVLMTVMFASVLSIVGMASKFESPRLRAAVLGFAGLVLTITVVVIVLYPVARE